MTIDKNPLHDFEYCPRCGQSGFSDHNQRAKYCRSCDLTFYANVASAVACLVQNNNEQFLFVRRAQDPAKGTLDLPGGFTDPLESIEQTVARELYEETRLTPKSIRYLTSHPNIYPFSGVTIYTCDLFFHVQVDNFDDATAQDDAAELVICSWQDVDPQEFGLLSIQTFMRQMKSSPDLGLSF